MADLESAPLSDANKEFDGGVLGMSPAKAVKFFVCCTAVLSVVVLGLAIALAKKGSAASCNSIVPPPPMPQELYTLLPLHTQETDYTCGPSSALSVFKAYGRLRNASEARLAFEMSTTSEVGTNWSAIAQVAVDRGFHCHEHSNSTIDYLKERIAAGYVTIIGYQAWKDPANYTYNHDWQDGHFSVVCGYNATGLLLMDPWMGVNYPGALDYGYIDNADLMRRWHFADPNKEWGLALTLFVPGVALEFTEVQPPNVLYTQ